MDESGDYYAKSSQKKTNATWLHLHTESKKTKTNTLKFREQTGGCQSPGKG